MSNKEVTAFYNNYNDKLIRDYLLENKRLSSAIKNLSTKIPTTTQTLLDIGCGIGWSSHEFAKQFNKTNVIGIDLSPQLIDTAEKLFNQNNLEYRVQDVSEGMIKTNFDVMVLIDVYEHISVAQRTWFHAFLKENIADNGRLLFACPSVYHQSWLKNNKPEGLQPIDEDITLNDLKGLADFLGGEVTYFEYKSIWRNCDYFHAVIQTKVDYEGRGYSLFNDCIKLEGKEEKIERVQNSLGDMFDIEPYKIKKTTVFNKIKKKIQAK